MPAPPPTRCAAASPTPADRIRGRTALVWLGLAVSALAVYLAVRDVDFDRVWEALRQCRYWTLAPALALLVVANLLRAWRWQLQFTRRRRGRASVPR